MIIIIMIMIIIIIKKIPKVSHDEEYGTTIMIIDSIKMDDDTIS